MSRTKLLLILSLTAVAVTLYFLTGCDKLITETVEKTIAGNPTAEFTADVEVGCEPLTVHFTDASIGNYQKLIWDFGDGTTDSVAEPVHTFTTGLYDVKLTIFDTLYTGDDPAYQGQDSEQKKRFIQVGSSVGDILASDSAACPGTAITFTPTDTGNVDSVRWNFGDGTAPTTLMVPTHTYDSIGSFHVTLTAYGECGVNSVTDSNKVVITPCPDVVIYANVTEGCVPLTVTFTDSTHIDYTDSLGDTIGILSRTWDFDDGLTGTLPEHVITYNTPGKKTVKLTITDLSGGVKTDSIVDFVTVWDTITANFTALTPAQLCYNPFSQFLVTFAPTYPGTFDSLYWDFGDGTFLLDTNVTSGPRHPSHAYTQPGEYDITLTVGGPCGEATTTQISFVVLSAPIQPDSLAFAIVPDSGDTGTQFAFTDQVNGIVLSREWDFGDGSAVDTDSSTTHKFTAFNNYWVKFKAANSCGEWIDSMLIKVVDTTGTTK